MKKYFLIALMAALGFSMMQAQQSFPTQARAKQAHQHCRNWRLGH